jgi:DNA-binding MarR family transcriptional regulator
MEAATKNRASRAGSDRELAGQLGTLLLRCLGSGGGEVLRLIDDSGLSFVQMKTVVTLLAPEPVEAITVSEIAEALEISPASASRAVDGLVKRRLATRSEDAQDRRVRRVALTTKGAELADQIISARLAGIEDFVASLGDNERSKLADALGALMEHDEMSELYARHVERSGR